MFRRTPFCCLAISSAILAVISSPSAHADDWTALGADAGMTKYSADNIPSTVAPLYTKRFYSILSNDPVPYLNFWYAQSVIIKNGTAAIFSYDAAPFVSSDNFGQGHQLTLLNFNTGATTRATISPGTSAWASLPLPSGVTYTRTSGRYSFHLGQHPAEIDSGHFTQAMVWADDGRIYLRHGGDDPVTGAYDPATNAWSRLVPLKGTPTASNYNSFFEGDANGFIQYYDGKVLYRAGDTRQTSPYHAVDVSPAAWASGTVGNWLRDIGPNIPASPAGQYYSGLRYGDIPKATTVTINGTPTPVSILSGLVAASASSFQVRTTATNLNTGATLWTRDDVSDGGGAQGFYTSTADYWRYIATNDGAYVMYDGPTTAARTLRAINIADGSQRWSMPLPSTSPKPLLASHDNALFVVGKSAQYKLDLATGAVLWSASNTFQTENNYFLSSDPLYRPMVLTDSTLWFIDGGSGSAAHNLIGLSTADGHLVQSIDLAALVAQKPNESLLAVNDLVEADGKLAVLLAIRSTSALSSSNLIAYQDLIVLQPIPEPHTLALVLLAAPPLLFRRRRAQV